MQAKWEHDDLLLEASADLTKQSPADLGTSPDSTHDRRRGYLELRGRPTNQPRLLSSRISRRRARGRHEARVLTLSDSLPPLLPRTHHIITTARTVRHGLGVDGLSFTQVDRAVWHRVVKYGDHKYLAVPATVADVKRKTLQMAGYKGCIDIYYSLFIRPVYPEDTEDEPAELGCCAQRGEGRG